MDASDYELNERRPGPTKLPKGDDNNFIPGVPPQYEPRRDAERETHYRRGTSPDDVSEQVKEDWRYWAARKMNGQWPPTYSEMPHNPDGSVKISLWNKIWRKVTQNDNMQLGRMIANSGMVDDAYAGDSELDDDMNADVKTKKKKKKDRRRRKRFIISGLIAVVAAISSAIFTAYEVDRLASNAEHNLDSTVHVLEAHESRLNIDEHTIENLNSSIKLVMTKVTNIAHRLKADELVLEVSQIMNRFFQEHRRIVTGLAALSHHRLPPELVSVKSLTTTMINLRRKVEHQNMRLSIKNFNEIFNLEASYVAYPNGNTISLHDKWLLIKYIQLGTIWIFLHVPIYDMNEKMTLFSYDQTPFIVPQNGSKVALRIEAENDLIAVSRDDTRHQVYSWSDLHSCKKSGAGQHGLLLCPNANVYFREDDNNCLVGCLNARWMW